MSVRRPLVAVLSVVFALLLPGLAGAQDKKDEKKLGWSDTAEFGYVATSGNSDSSTFGLKNTLARDWEMSRFELKLGAVRVESTPVPFYAVGTSPADAERQENDSQLTAENYFLTGRYDRNISKTFFWFTGAGWDRNTFAGIENRYTFFGGVGNIWFDTEKWKWRTDYSLSGTKQNDVVEQADVNDTFLGFRLSSNLVYNWSPSGSYGNDTIVDENLDNTSDLRVNMTNWAQLTITSHLALKVSLQWLYDNVPADVLVDLIDINTGTLIGQAAVPADELDSIFTTALVIKY